MAFTSQTVITKLKISNNLKEMLEQLIINPSTEKSAILLIRFFKPEITSFVQALRQTEPIQLNRKLHLSDVHKELNVYMSIEQCPAIPIKLETIDKWSLFRTLSKTFTGKEDHYKDFLISTFFYIVSSNCDYEKMKEDGKSYNFTYFLRTGETPNEIIAQVSNMLNRDVICYHDGSTFEIPKITQSMPSSSKINFHTEREKLYVILWHGGCSIKPGIYPMFKNNPFPQATPNLVVAFPVVESFQDEIKFHGIETFKQLTSALNPLTLSEDYKQCIFDFCDKKWSISITQSEILGKTRVAKFNPSNHDIDYEISSKLKIRGATVVKINEPEKHLQIANCFSHCISGHSRLKYGIYCIIQWSNRIERKDPSFGNLRFGLVPFKMFLSQLCFMCILFEKNVRIFYWKEENDKEILKSLTLVSSLGEGGNENLTVDMVYNEGVFLPLYKAVECPEIPNETSKCQLSDSMMELHENVDECFPIEKNLVDDVKEREPISWKSLPCSIILQDCRKPSTVPGRMGLLESNKTHQGVSNYTTKLRPRTPRAHTYCGPCNSFRCNDNQLRGKSRKNENFKKSRVSNLNKIRQETSIDKNENASRSSEIKTWTRKGVSDCKNEDSNELYLTTTIGKSGDEDEFPQISNVHFLRKL